MGRDPLTGSLLPSRESLCSSKRSVAVRLGRMSETAISRRLIIGKIASKPVDRADLAEQQSPRSFFSHRIGARRG
jgi:hypothetical protein